MLEGSKIIGGALGGFRTDERLQWVKPEVRGLNAIEANSVFSARPAPKMPRHVEISKNRHGKTVCYFRRDRKTPRIRIRSEPGTPEFSLEVENARNGLKPAKAVVSFVYFIRSGDRVKIGVSKDPRARLSDLRIGSSRLLRIRYITPGDRAKERELHRLFASDRVNGEWFIYSRQIRDWIASDEAARVKA